MNRVLLIHWNEPEAKERARRLRAAGFRVSVHHDSQGGVALRKVRDKPPDVFVIDLARLPSHGREVGTYFRQTKSTRLVPILFVGGAADKVERTRQLLPDAVYTTWARLSQQIEKAIKRPSKAPHVPQPMAGYSGTPLPKKLGLKAGQDVALLGAPEDFTTQLGAIVNDLHIKTQARGHADLILLFVQSRGELKRRLSTAQRMLNDGGSVWIAWPKRASSIVTDLTQQHIRETGLASGLVDYKICAIDDTWSGLRFARRRNKK